MRITIVTGIFEPEIGGPATYAPTLATKLAEAGNDVTVITFSPKKLYDNDSSYPFKLVRVVRGNRILNRIRFLFAVVPHIRKGDCIYMLDWFAAGLPASVVARIFRKPYVVRVGGDYLWEQRYLESGKTPIPLIDFYRGNFYRHYPVLFRIVRFVLRGAAHVVFNSDIQREIYEEPYGLTATSTIYNPVPRIETAGITRGTPTKEFVYWGRFIVMKNLDTLVRAFAQATLPEGYTLALIGEGPRKKEIEALVQELGLASRVSVLPAMKLPQVLERVKNSRAFILPSWTDISPNQVYEALSLGLPALVTKENYLSIRDRLPLTIDPSSVHDISAKLEMFADDSEYQTFANAFKAIHFEHTWDDVAQQHEELFRNIV